MTNTYSKTHKCPNKPLMPLQTIKTLIGLLCLLLLSPITIWAATINVPADQPTIQAAVNAAAAGDEIIVANGTYNESVNLATGPAGITIQAATPGGATVNGGAAPAFFASNHTGDITIDGFTLTSTLVSPTGGIVQMNEMSGLLTVSNCTINNGTTFTAGVSTPTVHGIYLVNTTNVPTNASILNNTFGAFGNNDLIHIFAGQNNVGGDANIVIDNNTNNGAEIQDSAIDIELEGNNATATVVVTNNNFGGWTLSGRGISFRIGTGGPLSSNLETHIIVDNNTLTNPDGHAIYFDMDGLNGMNYITATNNTITGNANTESGIYVDSDSTIDGGTSTFNISNNNISNITDSGIYIRPFMDDPGVVTWNFVIDGNTIDNPNTDNTAGEGGIIIDDSSAIDDENFIINAEITNNTIINLNASSDCIRIEEPTTTTAAIADINYELSGNTACTPVITGSPDAVTNPVPSSLDLLAIGNFVWNDLNNNGIQDGGGEVGIAGVLISYSGNGFSGTTTTNSDGIYFLPSLTPGTYTITATPPSDFPTISASGQGGSTALDSDFSAAGTASATLTAGGTNNLDIDLGLFASCPTSASFSTSEFCGEALTVAPTLVAVDLVHDVCSGFDGTNYMYEFVFYNDGTTTVAPAGFNPIVDDPGQNNWFLISEMGVNGGSSNFTCSSPSAQQFWGLIDVCTPTVISTFALGYDLNTNTYLANSNAACTGNRQDITIYPPLTVEVVDNGSTCGTPTVRLVGLDGTVCATQSKTTACTNNSDTFAYNFATDATDDGYDGTWLTTSSWAPVDYNGTMC